MRGSIRPRGRQCWQIVLDAGRSADGRRRQIYKTVHGGKKAADQELTAMKREVETGTSLDAEHITVSQYLDRWLEDCRGRVGVKTWERYAMGVRLHIKPYIGQLLLKKLAPLNLTNMYATLLVEGRHKGGGLSAHTVRHAHVILKIALRQAVKWQLVVRNPLDAVESPRAKRIEMQALNDEEIARLLEASAQTRLHLPIMLAVSTGMRRGEILGLRWADVSLDTAQLSVRRSLQQIGRAILFHEPKTAKSRRTIALPPVTVAALRRHRAKQAAERLALGESYDDQDLVLAGPQGSPWRPDSICTLYGAIVKRAGLKHVRFHDLRHSHATQLLRLGIPAKVVSERLGHATIGITLDTYSHVLPGMQEEAAAKVDVALRAAIGNLASAG